MYALDRGYKEIEIAKTIVGINEKYKNEEFSVKALRDNVYTVESKNGTTPTDRNSIP